MNFSSMEYFVVLAQERNFTRAAERLHITQQSLSSHVAGMEKSLAASCWCAASRWSLPMRERCCCGMRLIFKNSQRYAA